MSILGGKRITGVLSQSTKHQLCLQCCNHAASALMVTSVPIYKFFFSSLSSKESDCLWYQLVLILCSSIQDIATFPANLACHSRINITTLTHARYFRAQSLTP
jgi:hypothetical protein